MKLFPTQFGMLNVCSLAMTMCVPASAAIAALPAAQPCPLAGSWTLVAANLLSPDGSQSRDYGASPSGLLLIDSQGRYALQLYKSERPLFATGDKKTASAIEYESAVMGSSTHYGTLALDPDAHTLTFSIEHSAFKNWEGTKQKRTYELNGDELSYRVTARPDGGIPISIWKKMK
ncbi:lipocalin-like domain-containing protein [Janthinobacterium sp.]|uniref:lipocalin-like domain-containing protein n=1 Tax=Janthinobacterium sp. TaxID=1871054 RepID=UPI00293D2672|nr:lipocalin-like domain-containing protein [Janthinobacterium sp.]